MYEAVGIVVGIAILILIVTETSLWIADTYLKRIEK